MTSTYAVQAESLSFSYSGDPILSGLTFAVRPGEIVGVLGPNGSGKTTLLKNLLLYLKPRVGSISYFGREHTTLSSRELSRLAGLVPQKSGGGASLSAGEMVMLGRLPHLQSRWSGFSDHDRAVVERTMQCLDIHRFRERQCSTLSGGEFQKVLLARALVQESSILFLDEATANLDMHHAIEIMDLVRDRVVAGGTAVAVMHDLNLAAGYCDRVVLLKDGVVRYEGAPREVYRPDVIRSIFGVDLYVAEDDAGVPFVLPRVSRQHPKAVTRVMQKERCLP